jgi:hypothetical protein
LERTGDGRRYHFYSHFDPAWNGLVWSRDFPVRMEELLMDQPDHASGTRDRRMIDASQVSPSRKGDDKLAAPATTTSFDLAPYGWLMVFLTLAVERILSFKKAKDG